MTSTAQRTHSETQTPLAAVLARLRDCSGFPTLSTTISDINRSVASDTQSTRQLTQVILRDASLTTKLLQVVNSAVYGQYRGRIRTVSKAVLILGFDAVRNTAMSLMMLEFSRGRLQEKALQDELIGAFFAGVVSKALCHRLGVPNSEEAVICTMFQSLGRLLVVFFLYEERRQIQSLIETGVPEELAAERVLGISYRDLGIGVAKHWNFPDRLVEGMQRLTARDLAPPTTELERLKLTTNLATDLYNTARRTSESEKTAALLELTKRYSGAIKLDTKELIAALDQGLKEIAERATTLNLPTGNSSMLSGIRVWTGGAADDADDERTDEAPGSDPLLEEVDALNALEHSEDTAVNAQQVLSAGIRDVTETLTSDFALNDVLQMVLETMYRGMGFTRTMIFVRDMRLSAMRARFGFGNDIESIIPKCSFPLAFAPDVFHVALDKGVDIAIENTQAPNIVERIPAWHRQVINAKSFLLLPVVLKSHAIGLLYADSERPEAIKITAEQLGLLRTLRSQTLLAFKHCTASARH
ncbi:MAG TPA: HDOD domain-containing protein [Steroidobacteraceae bacterium]|nr:HDOD domain-containing protein [Steroidobacteraceae bacterium]